jgi:phage anti-repressor protein
LYEEYKPFTIDLNDIAHWLETRKSKLRETLNGNYSIKIDYISIKSALSPNGQRVPKHGGHNKKLVLLTPDCFKMLCMRSKTKKADKIREYYLELEKLIDKYKDVIIEEKNKKIKLLENDLKKDNYPTGDYSYIIQEKDELGEIYFRIGQCKDLKNRMANHNSSSVHKKVISFKIKTDNKSQFESCLRSTMFNFRYKNNKDYYKIPDDMVNDAIKACKNIVKNFKNDKIEMLGGKKHNNTDDIIIDIKKIDSDIKKMFSEMCECTMWNMYENPLNAYYNGKKITTEKLNEIIIHESMSNNILIVPVHRFEEYMEYIDLSNENITLKKLFNILFKYYNKEELTLEQLKRIPNDIDDYVKDAKKKIKTDKVYRIDIIGSLCRYEGIYEITDNVYKLALGS